MAINKIKIGEIEHELQTTIANVDGLQTVLDDMDGQLAKIIPVFIGTTEQYNQAYDNGEIAVGAIVMITDDEDLGDSTTSILGQAILGYMVLA